MKKSHKPEAGVAPKEAVDFPTAMEASHYSSAIELVQMDKVISSKNSIFYVIGRMENGLRVSIRFWKESMYPGVIELGYRVRVGDLEGVDGAIVKAPDSLFTDIKFPIGGSWTGGRANSGYRSITGRFKFNTDAWQISEIVHIINEQNLTGKLLNSICELIPMVAHFTPEVFSKVVTALITDVLSHFKAPIPVIKSSDSHLIFGSLFLFWNCATVNLYSSPSLLWHQNRWRQSSLRK